MTTWGELRTQIRLDLKDTSTTRPKWSDDVLYLYLQDAVGDYSMYFPVRERALLPLVGSAYTLPSDFVNDIGVEYPEGTFLERRIVSPGHRYPTLSSPTLYYIDGEALYINSTPAENTLYLTYEAEHPVPATADDDTFVFTIRRRDLELVRLYVKSKCVEIFRTRQADLDRFKPAGDRDDNPLNPEVTHLMNDYRTKIAERYQGRSHRLRRSGNRQ